MNLHERERQRATWRRARGAHGLEDVRFEQFGLGGLGARVPGLAVRLLILPSDPEKVVTEFDDDAWEWWLALESKAAGRKIDWGYEHSATVSAMVRHDRVSDNLWEWNRYLALHRTGALEFGLGRTGAREGKNSRIFFLVAIVGRTLASISQYRSVIDRFAVEGPWELTLAMIGTEGSCLGHVAEGWAEPQDMWDHERHPCVEPNVQIRVEISEWPQTEEQTQALAFAIGGRIEDAWGIEQRRFIARTGANAGKFVMT